MRFVLVYVAAFVLFIGLATLGLKLLPLNDQGALEFDEAVWGQRVLVQGFRPKTGDLRQIGLTVRNPYGNVHDLLFKISKNGQVIREGAISGRNIPDGDFVRFNFAPVNESDGDLNLEISSPDSKEDEAFHIYMSSGSDEIFGKVAVNGEVKNSHIAGVLFSGQSDKGYLIVSIATSIWERLSGDWGFGLFYLGLICLVIASYYYAGRGLRS